jgi:uncharacterized protein YjbI with pentapeptide repeats
MVDEYRAAAAAMRDSAKWVLTTLGAIGAVLVSGIGLSSLANLHQTLYLVIAIVGLLVALAGVGWAIAQTAAILQPSTVRFAQLADLEPAAQQQNRPRYLKPLFPADADRLRGLGTSYAQLHAGFATALTARAAALQANYQNPSAAPLATAAQAAQARAKLYGDTIAGITAEAAYLEIKARLSTYRQLGAAACVVAGVVVFALALALPIWKNPDLHGAKLTHVQLNGVRLQRADFSAMMLSDVTLRDADLRGADFDHATLTRVDLMGANVSGASFDGTTWHGSICPDGTNSDVDGNSCSTHSESQTEIVPPPPLSTSIGAVKRHGRTVSITVRISPNHATVTAAASRKGSRRVLLRSAHTAPGTTVFTAALHPGRWTVTFRIHAEPGYTAGKPVTRTVQKPVTRTVQIPSSPHSLHK